MFNVVVIGAGISFAAYLEIERKSRQRRDDPEIFRKTPLYVLGGTFFGLVAAGVVKGARRRQSAQGE